MEKEMCVRILGSRVPVSSAVNHTCKVSRVGTAYSKTGELLHIVDTNLITQPQLQSAKSAFLAGDYDEACNQRMSFISQFAPAYLPAKGEVCIARIEDVDGTLYIRGFQAIPVVTGNKLGSDFFASLEQDVAEVADSAPVKGKK